MPAVTGFTGALIKATWRETELIANVAGMLIPWAAAALLTTWTGFWFRASSAGFLSSCLLIYIGSWSTTGLTEILNANCEHCVPLARWTTFGWSPCRISKSLREQKVILPFTPLLSALSKILTLFSISPVQLLECEKAESIQVLVTVWRSLAERQAVSSNYERKGRKSGRKRLPRRVPHEVSKCELKKKKHLNWQADWNRSRAS